MTRPTQQEVANALKTINAVALIAAIHGTWTKPEPDLIKLIAWLKQEFGLE